MDLSGSFFWQLDCNKFTNSEVTRSEGWSKETDDDCLSYLKNEIPVDESYTYREGEKNK